jgi:tubulin---tyrosine ligase
MFGVDLLLSASDSLESPTVTLLEFNASPDFGQSGDRLQPHLAEMFKGVVRLAIAPFFGCEVIEEEEVDGELNTDVVRHGWRLIGEAATRGEW